MSIRPVLGSRASIGGPLGSGRGGAAAALPVAGAVLWLDASQITGLSDGNAVSTWPDMSGNGYDATQGTGSAQPTYKTGIVNGKPVVRFDGGDWLGFTQQSLASFSIFVVNRKDAVTNKSVLLENSAVAGNQYLAAPSSNASGAYSAQIATTIANSPSATVNAWHIAGLVRSSGIIVAYVDGSGGSGASNSTTFAPNRIASYSQVGTTYWFSGDIAEIILYGSALGATDRQAVQTYLGTKYGITVS